jgi:hypothetical protein
MRVSMKYNAVPTACEAFSYGQVEDYTVNIVSTARETENEMASLDISLYPNPVNGAMLNVSGTDEATYKIYSILGQQMAQGKVDNGMIPVSQIQAGTYLIELTSKGQTVVKRFIKQ